MSLLIANFAAFSSVVTEGMGAEGVAVPVDKAGGFGVAVDMSAVVLEKGLQSFTQTYR